MKSQKWSRNGGLRPGAGLAATDRGAQLSFYFLMAATAFIAASSRSSAAVMGRPLSVRIRFASCTLVPETRRNGYSDEG